MAHYSFAQLDQWAAKAARRMDAVTKDATQTVVEKAQEPKSKGGNMPVDTGNLRNSLMSTISGGAGATGPASYVMVAGSMQAGQAATFTWTAEYAAAVNSGARGRAGAHYLEGAADQWPAIVAASIAKAKASVN